MEENEEECGREEELLRRAVGVVYFCKVERILTKRGSFFVRVVFCGHGERYNNQSKPISFRSSINEISLGKFQNAFS